MASAKFFAATSASVLTASIAGLLVAGFSSAAASFCWAFSDLLLRSLIRLSVFDLETADKALGIALPAAPAEIIAGRATVESSPIAVSGIFLSADNRGLAALDVPGPIALAI